MHRHRGERKQVGSLHPEAKAREPYRNENACGTDNVLQAFSFNSLYLGPGKNLRYDRDPSQELGIPEEDLLEVEPKMPGTLTRLTLRALDSFARLLPRKDSGPQHLHTGRRGEEAAYFHLRKQGYVIIARNYRSPRSRSELDLVGWDGRDAVFY